jgi:superfamily II DNA or RNA helicase
MNNKKNLKLENPLEFYDTALSRQGYSVKKDNLSKKELNDIKILLTVQACSNPKYADVAESFPVYGENDKKIYLPRYWGIQNFGPPKINKLFPKNKSLGKEIDIKFTGEIRSAQEPVASAFLENVNNNEGGIITLQCGGGKTVTTLYLISKVKKKTLVVVHKTFLMHQWKERIEQFLPDANIGYIQGNTLDIDNKDIVLGMLQSISMKDYHKNIFEEFGFVVFDECHHLGAEVFSKALSKSACPFTLGLSATPDRKDGLTKVFKWYLGDFVYKAKKNKDTGVDVKVYYYLNDDPTYSNEVVSYTNKIITPKMINNICYCKRRNDLILYLLPKLIEQNRHILILSDRKEQLKYLKTQIDEQHIATSGYYLGGMKQAHLNESEKQDIMLGTYNMVSEGFDCKRLNTLILASPRSDVEQSIGRILRLQAHQRTIKPLVIDIGDIFSIYTSQMHKRLCLYEKEGYDITGYIVDDNLVKMKIKKMERYSDISKNGEYTVIKLRRMKKIERDAYQKKQNSSLEQGVYVMLD